MVESDEDLHDVRGAQAERLLERVPASALWREISIGFSLFIALCRSVSMAQQDAQNGGSKNAAAAATVSFVAVKPQLLVEAPKANVAILFFKVVFGTEEVGRTLNPKRKAKHELPLILSA